MPSLVTCAPPGGLFLPPSPQQSSRLPWNSGSSVSTSALYCISHDALHLHKHPLLPGGLKLFVCDVCLIA